MSVSLSLVEQMEKAVPQTGLSRDDILLDSPKTSHPMRRVLVIDVSLRWNMGKRMGSRVLTRAWPYAFTETLVAFDVMTRVS